MKRSLYPALFALLVAVLAACGTPDTEEDFTEPAPLLGDVDLDRASTSFVAPAEVVEFDAGDLMDDGVSTRLTPKDRSAAPWLYGPGAGAGLASQDVVVDTPSHVVYAYIKDIRVNRNRIWVKENDAGLDPRFRTDIFLYEGLRPVDSVAITADGELIAFIAEAADGNNEVYLYDVTGSRTGQPETLIRVTDTPYSETDIDMSLDGDVLVWQGVATAPGSGAPSPVIATFDPSGSFLQPVVVDFGLEIVEPSVSGDGSLAVFVANGVPGIPAGLGAIATLPADLSDNATLLYAGDVADPSISPYAGTLMFAEIFDGVPFVSLATLDTGEFLADLLAGVDAEHPKQTSDGGYFVYVADSDVYAREIVVDDPESADEVRVSDRGRSPNYFDEYQANWAKLPYGLRYYGSTYGAPEFTRPDDGSGLSDADRTSPYHAYSFEAPVTDFYELLSNQDFDGYLALYVGEFDPDDPNDGYLAGNDDFGGSYDPDDSPPGTSRIVAELMQGQLYTLVTTACGDPDAGCGPDAGQFTNLITRGAEPPLPPDVLPEPNPDGFDITLRFFGDPITAEQAAAFTDAAARWGSIITGDLADLPGFSLPQDFSFPGAPPVEGTLDDVLIDVNFTNIDGPSGILGRAGPSIIRSGTPDDPLTVYGIMEFDVSEFGPGGFFDDPQSYQDVIVHEMGHVIGIGTLWTLTGNTEGILSDPPTVPAGLPNPDYDPRFTGPLATAEYQRLLTEADYDLEDSVPIANTGGPGNFNGHWREIAFGDELMTPYAAGVELLSTMTAASLGDLGYTVDLESDAIDFEYVLPPPRVPGVFRQTAPDVVEYVEAEDFVAASDAPKIAVEAPVTNVDLTLDTIDASDSGCEASDFDGFPAGEIALVRRGTCAFADKVNNAAAAGAVGVIIMNQGNSPDRTGLLDPVLGDVAIPVVFITFDLGVDLANTEGLEVFIDTGVEPEAGLRALDADFEEILQAIGSMRPDGTITLFPGVDGTQLEPYGTD